MAFAPTDVPRVHPPRRSVSGILVLLSVLYALLGPHALESATRLGLFHTQEEVWCWRQRAGLDAPGTNGLDCVPGSATTAYKTLGDVSTNSPGDWDRIAANRAAFAANPSSERWTSPALNAQGCVDPGAGSVNANWPEIPGDQATWSFRLRDAAFYSLVTGSTADHAALKQELLWLTSQAFMQFGNPSGIWCFGILGDNDIAYWSAAVLTRVLFAYEYIGRQNFTAGERDQMDRWFFDAADFWRRDADEFFNGQFVNRWQGNYTPTTGCSTNPPAAYVGGPTIPFWYGQIYSNRSTSMIRFATLSGIMLQQATRAYTDGRYGTLAQIVQSGQMYVQEYVRYGVFPAGVVGEFARRTDVSPDLGWAYAGVILGEILEITDAFARTGDTSLYDYTTNQGLCGSAGTINDGGSRQGQNKDLLFATQSYMKYHTDQYARYWPTTSTADNRIDGRSPRDGSSWHGIYETGLVMGNLYFQDAFVTQAYTRTHPNALPYPANPQHGPTPWMGENGLFPGVLFMFGQMEGIVNPYGGVTNILPSISITTPTLYATGTVSGSTVTVSGPATDDVGVTGVTWSCPGCPVTTGTASCAPACGASTTTTTWTITNLALPANGQTVMLTVTASDGTQTAPDTLTLTRQDIANLQSGLELHFPFNESSGATTADASGQGHTGTLQSGATFGTGETGNGVVLNGTTGQVTVTGTLTSPAALTLAGWVNLSGGTESATVINIGNAVGLRIDSPNTSRLPIGFYYTGSSWPNLSGGTAFPASGWHHLAYTMDSTRQVLYLDGVVIAMGVGVPSGPNYSTGNTTTSLGRHPGDAMWDLQGSLDDVRVWTRALSEVDIDALVAGDEPVEPAIQITAPNSGNDTSVNTSPIATLLGVASDSDGTIASVTVSCVPSCGSPTVTGLADWSVASLPLAYGRNVITVTATDNDTLTNSDSITIIRYCPTDISTELELWLDLNGDATDSSGAGRHGIPSGGVTWGAGVVGSGAVVLDGTGALTVSSLLDTLPTLTLSLWINLTSLPTDGELISIGDYAALRVLPSGLRGLYYAGADVWRGTVVTGSLVGGWHHVAYVIMPGLQQLYQDGLPVGAPTPYTDPIVYTGLGPTTEIGRWAYAALSGNYVLGSLDEVRVYGCPQDAAGIQAIEDYAEAGSVNLSAPLRLRCLSCQ